MEAQLTSNSSRIPIEARSVDPDAVWRRRFWLLAAGLLIFRVAYLAVVPLDLVPDEAYYWDWSRRLDWGYYSKPPLVAWLIAAATRTFGHHPLAVRLPAALLGSVALVAGYALAARMYSPRVGFWGSVLASASAGAAALGMLMTIDAPLVACWCLALYGFWRLVESPERPLPWMALTALAIGLGMLAKQTMLGFFPLAGLFLLSSPPDRRQLLRPALWVTALLAGLFLLPVLWWNSRHGWLTLQHTREHFGGEPVSLAKHLARFGEFLAGQLGVVSPVTAPLLAVVLAAAMLGFSRLGRRERFLICFSGVPLAGVLVLSLVQRVQPNWPAPFYTAGLILVAAWSQQQLALGSRLDRRRGAFRTALVVGLASTVLVYAAPFVLSAAGLAGSQVDIAARLRGWSQLGGHLGQLIDRLPESERLIVIATTGRGPISELAFYTPGQPRVYAWRFGDRVLSQHDLWDGPYQALGCSALIVTPAGAAPPPELAASFERVERLGPLPAPASSRPEQRLDAWHGEVLRDWPLARLGVPGPENRLSATREVAPGPHRR